MIELLVLIAVIAALAYSERTYRRGRKPPDDDDDFPLGIGGNL